MRADDFMGLAGELGDAGLAIQDVIAHVNALRPMSIESAKALFARTGSAIVEAVPELTDLPGAAAQSARTTFATFVDAASSILPRLASAPNPLPESDASAIRSAVIKVFIAYNQAAEGSSTLADARDQFFSDVVTNLENLPHDAAAAIGGAVTAVAGGAAAGLLEGLAPLLIALGLIALAWSYFKPKRGNQ